MSETKVKRRLVTWPAGRWRWRKRIAMCLVVLLVGSAVYFAINHYQVSAALEKAIAELDESESGWRIEDIEAAREKVPDEENSAPLVARVAEHLPEYWSPKELLAAVKGNTPAELPPAATVTALENELGQLEKALETATPLAGRPRGRPALQYHPTYILTDLQDRRAVQNVCGLLCLQALHQAHQERPGPALRCCRAALNAARSVGDEPFLVSQMLRANGAIQTANAVERVLAWTRPATQDLEAVQAALGQEDRHDAGLIVARGERAGTHALFAAIESGDVSLLDIARPAGTPPFLGDVLLGWYHRDKVRWEHPVLLHQNNRRIEIAQTPPHLQGEMEEEQRRERNRLTFRYSLVPLFVFGRPEGRRFREVSSRMRSLAALLAAERYRLTRGRWPGQLTDLVPAFLPAVPMDPFDGRPLRYRKTADGVMVYSVGPDREDNNGELTDDLAEKNKDVGHRLYNVEARRRPAPAVPEPKDPE